MSDEPTAAQQAVDGHVCPDDGLHGDEPVVVGGWLRFLNCDHDGMTWVPVHSITRMEVGPEYLDVTHVAPNDDRVVNGRPYDEAVEWDRIRDPEPWLVAEAVARAADRSRMGA